MAIEQDVKNRVPITVAIMMATVMNSLDTTIANVALPHMQGSVSASADQITWVLTSYIVAAAIMTPLAGWLAARIGRKRMFLISIGGFTVASMLCGIATNVPEIVLFRVLQGLFGASLIPLSQVLLLDINPPAKHGQAMAMWGAGAILGPIIGPAVGGYLTENFSWRWCFYINLPIGILAFLGILFFISADRPSEAKKFDFLGFGMLTLFVGAFQILLDRGPGEDWFHSGEIWLELALAVTALWVFAVHTLTTPHPFFDRALTRDRNFVLASVFGFFIGVLLFSSMALLPPMTQVLLGYPVLTSGLIGMPRGLGSFISMFIVGRLIGRVDTRLILFGGLCISSFAQWQMMHFDLSMTAWPLMISGLVQGFGLGLLFVPLSVLGFSTLSPRLRPEASSVYTLIRNLGSSVGISVMNGLLVANTQTVHSSLTAMVVPSDAVVRSSLPAVYNPATTAGAMALNGELTRQSTMIAYLDDFRLMFFLTIACMPLLLLMQPPKRADAELIHAAID